MGKNFLRVTTKKLAILRDFRWNFLKDVPIIRLGHFHLKKKKKKKKGRKREEGYIEV